MRVEPDDSDCCRESSSRDCASFSDGVAMSLP